MQVCKQFYEYHDRFKSDCKYYKSAYNLCKSANNFMSLKLCPVYFYFRHDDETTTDSTDDGETYGGLGIFEYSQKGLSHAINHTSELVQCGGHHGAYNTATNEVKHKTTIKKASLFSETRAKLNDTHEGMLKYVLYRVLWQAAIDLNNSLNAQPRGGMTKVQPRYCLQKRLPYTDTWSTLECYRGRTPRWWRSTYLSKHVLVTREEIITWVLAKVGLEKTLRNLVMVITELKWDCYGVVSLQNNGEVTRRRVVGLGSRGRRDFVRLKGSSTDNGTGTGRRRRRNDDGTPLTDGPDTALSVQVSKSANIIVNVSCV